MCDSNKAMTEILRHNADVVGDAKFVVVQLKKERDDALKENERVTRWARIVVAQKEESERKHQVCAERDTALRARIEVLEKDNQVFIIEASDAKYKVAILRARIGDVEGMARVIKESHHTHWGNPHVTPVTHAARAVSAWLKEG
jgi:hypothetical protein